MIAPMVYHEFSNTDTIVPKIFSAWRYSFTMGMGMAFTGISIMPDTNSKGYQKWIVQAFPITMALGSWLLFTLAFLKPV